MSTMWDRFARGVRDAIDRDAGGRGRGGGPSDPPTGLADKLGLVRINDEALGTELERRRRVRGKIANRRPAGIDELDALADGRRTSVQKVSLSKAYASLEIRASAGKFDIERAYRRLLRQYHPDRHIGDDEQHKSAIALATSLTDSYVALMTSFDRR